MIKTSTSFLVKRSRDAAQHFLDRRLRVVGDDEDQDALSAQIKRANGTHAPFLKLKTGHSPGGPRGSRRCRFGSPCCSAPRTASAVARIARSSLSPRPRRKSPRLTERAPDEKIRRDVIGRLASIPAHGSSIPNPNGSGRRSRQTIPSPHWRSAPAPAAFP